MNKSRMHRRRQRLIRRRRRFIVSVLLLLTLIVTGIFIVDKHISKGAMASNVDVMKRRNENINDLLTPFSELEVDSRKYEIHKALIEKKINVEKQQREEQQQKLKQEKQSKINEIKNKKVAYLTFDDGPSSKVTPKVLDILDEYDIKATFYVIGYLAEKNPELIIREYESGHAIGNHTYSHNYKHVYRSVEDFLGELNKNEKVLKEILGKDYVIETVRFPGGSFGDRRKPFRDALTKKGITYVDWNSLNGDAEGHNIPKDKLVKRFKETAKGKDKLIILMHDAGAKQTTVQALPEIIEYLINEGYQFRAFNQEDIDEI